MNHEWEDFGPGHECSYIDCFCDHPACLKCGVEQDSPEAALPCSGIMREEPEDDGAV